MTMGRSLPPLDPRYRAFAGLGAARVLPRSAKALATNVKVYQRTLESGATADQLAAAAASMPDSIPMGGKGQGLYSRSLLMAYFAPKGAVVNAANGKPASEHERGEMVARLMRWQMLNKRRPPLKRPTTTYYGRDAEAWTDFAKGIAIAALMATGAYFVGQAVMTGAAASTGATAAGATAAEAAAAGAAAEGAVAAGAGAVTAADVAAAAAIEGGATTAAASTAASAASGSIVSGGLLKTAAKIVIPIIAQRSGVPIPTSVADGSMATIASDFAKGVAEQQLGRALTAEQEADMDAAVKAQQAALVQASDSARIPTVNENLPPELRAGQARSALSSEATGWVILMVVAGLALSS